MASTRKSPAPKATAKVSPKAAPEPVPAQEAAPPAPPVEAKPAKVKKPKLVRDSFTMPETEYALIAAIKQRCLDQGLAARKSEVLRAALANLARLGDKSVATAIRRLEPVKTGRPAKGSR